MRVAAVSIVILALVIGIVPQLTDCSSQGRSLTTSTGMAVPMKCTWTAMAEIALAVSLLAVGGQMAFTRRREARRSLGITGTVLGAMVVLVPTVLIGVCANNAMLCRSIMAPTLILSGTLVAIISLAMVVMPARTAEQLA